MLYKMKNVYFRRRRINDDQLFSYDLYTELAEILEKVDLIKDEKAAFTVAAAR